MSIVIQLISGLEELQNAPIPICHNDLKPANIFIDKRNIACIGDFGSSRKFEKGKTHLNTITQFNL